MTDAELNEIEARANAATDAKPVHDAITTLKLVKAVRDLQWQLGEIMRQRDSDIAVAVEIAVRERDAEIARMRAGIGAILVSRLSELHDVGKIHEALDVLLDGAP